MSFTFSPYAKLKKSLANGRLSSTVARYHCLLIFLLVLTFLKGWLWASVFPPFQPSDELQHLGYARDIARYGTIIIEARDIFLPEEVIANEFAQLTNISGYRQPLDLSLSRINELEQLKTLLSEPENQPEAEPSPWVHYFSRYHPPLYYSLGSLLDFSPSDMLTHLARGRMISVFLTMVMIAFTYFLTREVFPDRPYLWLATAVIVSFLPMVTYIGSSFTNQALEMTLFTIFFWSIARIIRLDITWKRGLFLGIILSLGLLTKVSFLIAVPLSILVAIYNVWLSKDIKKLWLWGFVFLMPLVLSSFWYIDYLSQSLGGLADSRPEAATCPAFPIYLSRLPVRNLLFGLWNQSMGAFGHRDSYLPQTLYTITQVSFFFAILGWSQQIFWTLRHKTTPYRYSQKQQVTGILFFLAWGGIILFYFLIGYLVSCDQRAEFLQGRQLVSVLSGFCLFLLMGWLSLANRYQKHLLTVLVICIVFLNLFTLGKSISWRYYGSQRVMSTQLGDVVSQPLTSTHSVSQCYMAKGETLNRIDLWLAKPAPAVSGVMNLQVIDQHGDLLLETSSKNIGWNTTYASYFLFDPIKISDEFCLKLSGDFDKEVQVWADGSVSNSSWLDGNIEQTGSLSINMYEFVPWYQYPARMAIQSADLYTAEFYWVLSITYSFMLVLFLILFFRQLYKSPKFE